MVMSVKNLTNEQLKAQRAAIDEEIAARAAEERHKAVKIASERRDLFIECLTMRMIDLFIPEHSRTSCSDDSLANADLNEGRVRCHRCFALEVLKYQTMDYSVTPKLVFEGNGL